MRLTGDQQSALVFRDDGEGDVGVAILEPGGGREEVARIGQTVGADRAEIG